MTSEQAFLTHLQTQYTSTLQQLKPRRYRTHSCLAFRAEYEKFLGFSLSSRAVSDLYKLSSCVFMLSLLYIIYRARWYPGSVTEVMFCSQVLRSKKDSSRNEIIPVFLTDAAFINRNMRQGNKELHLLEEVKYVLPFSVCCSGREYRWSL